MESTKVIKRYQNRKLYDTEASAYVTLDKIAEMVRSGRAIQVVDNRDQRDITEMTLIQVIFEKQREAAERIPISTLSHIIRKGDGSLGAFLAGSAEGNQLEIVRELEEQVKQLGQKLAELEDKYGIALVQETEKPVPREVEA